jgi:hypothetical protein
MEWEKIFGSCKQKLNLLSRLKGIHIDTIMSTPIMENRICKLSGPFVAFITMRSNITNGGVEVPKTPCGDGV